MQSQQNLADKLHSTPNNLQNTQHKSGIAYLERILTFCTVSVMQWGHGGAYNIKKNKQQMKNTYRFQSFF